MFDWTVILVYANTYWNCTYLNDSICRKHKILQGQWKYLILNIKIQNATVKKQFWIVSFIFVENIIYADYTNTLGWDRFHHYHTVKLQAKSVYGFRDWISNLIQIEKRKQIGILRIQIFIFIFGSQCTHIIYLILPNFNRKPILYDVQYTFLSKLIHHYVVRFNNLLKLF